MHSLINSIEEQTPDPLLGLMFLTRERAPGPETFCQCPPFCKADANKEELADIHTYILPVSPQRIAHAHAPA